MEAELAPIRSRFRDLSATPALVDEALAAGADRARSIARTTIASVRQTMGLD
jgi:tryptophanyl-tRNA synthetase